MFRTDRVFYHGLQDLLNELTGKNYQIVNIIPIHEGEKFVVISFSMDIEPKFSM